MKILQKVGTLSLALLMVACTNTGNKVFKSIEEILGRDKEENNIVREIKPEIDLNIDNYFEQQDVVVSSENVSKYLDEIKNRLKKSEKRIENENLNNYKVLLGEYLVTPMREATTLKIANSPKNTNSRLRLEDGNLIFRTIYAGNYLVAVYQGNSLLKRININALTKYNFSEDNLFSVINENLDKNNKILEDSITLYKMYFPNGKNIKKINYFLLKYGLAIDSVSIINEALESLKSELLSYSDEEKLEIIKAAKLMKKEIHLPLSLYNTKNEELLEEIGNYLKNKAILDKKDVVFLEKLSETGILKENTAVIEKVNSWYKKNGDISKLKEIEKRKSMQENRETYFEIAMKNLNANPRLAIENFKKSLSNDKLTGSKKADTYYNLAVSYLKLGNRVEAIKYISLLKQEFSGTDWIKKAEKLLKK